MEDLVPFGFFAIERISEGQRFTTKLLSETNRPGALHTSSRSAD